MSEGRGAQCLVQSQVGGPVVIASLHVNQIHTEQAWGLPAQPSTPRCQWWHAASSSSLEPAPVDVAGDFLTLTASSQMASVS